MNAHRPPVTGDVTARVVGVQSVSIHGDIYHDAAVVTRPPDRPHDHPNAGQPVTVRLPHHVCPRAPAPGDVVRLSFLLGQVNACAIIEQKPTDTGD